MHVRSMATPVVALQEVRHLLILYGYTCTDQSRKIFCDNWSRVCIDMQYDIICVGTFLPAHVCPSFASEYPSLQSHAVFQP